ncbi:translation initiation factor 2 [Streptomyces axinellae]|uniref:translation initiation factor 2 n=1 Tax=Streptomyces axinellae TaxID=552788 RepID=UPI0031DE44F3
MCDVLFAVRTATTLHRLLDAAPALAGDRRIRPYFTLVPGSDFGAGALAALDGLRAAQLPWEEALRRPFGLVLAASANGGLDLLRGPLALLPHGAGFNRRIPGARAVVGADDAANGLHPEQLLLPDGSPLADVHALAHPGQLDRIAAGSPRAAARVAVVGDPTLDRLLESTPRRDRYRRALGTGRRRLVVLVSTWGPESLLARRPWLPLRMATELPYDTYQAALVLHPNEYARKAPFGLSQDLVPERRAGVLVPGPYEEWASVLVAADCVVTDHGSTALYAAALGLPVLGAYDGGGELLPGTPMARLLEGAPRLTEDAPYEGQLAQALAGDGAQRARDAASYAFGPSGNALGKLRGHLYGLLGLAPPDTPAEPEPLPLPGEVARRSSGLSAFAVDAEVGADTVKVVRRPVSGRPGHHLAAEEDWAGLRYVQSAGLLYRHAGPATGRTGHRDRVTLGDWSARLLAAYPGCRTAAAVLADDRGGLRVRGGSLLSVRIEAPGGGALPDPVAVLCGVHAWLGKHAGRSPVARVHCVVGELAATVLLGPASDEEAGALL